MFDYEEMILARQDADFDCEDECKQCPHKHNCRNQCLEVKEVYNPVLLALLGRAN